jgi:hypothetical protein
MKKFIYFCGMMLLSLNMMAQIDLNDKNWDTIVFDDFNDLNRQFDNTFQEPFMKWLSFTPSLFPSGVTKNDGHNIFQWNNCVIDGNDGVLRINSNHISNTPITCSQPLSYYIPPACFGRWFWCDSSHSSLYYYSGVIESYPIVEQGQSHYDKDWPHLLGQFRYGYFEIRCKVPIHEGAKSSFWLWGAYPNRFYEEIDVYEFSWDFENIWSTEWTHNPHPHGAGNPYCFTSGMYINKEDATFQPVDETSKAREYLMINDSLSNWHTFSCEWLPDHVLWFCDDKVVDEYYNADSIPSHHLTLKTGYQIDRYALQGHNSNNPPHWKEGGCMTIDYIAVYQLSWDCDTDEEIKQQTDLDGFDYAVKKSVSITSSIEPVCVEATDKMTFRSTDSFEITGPFQVDSGAEFTVIMQKCPNIE